MSGLAAGFNPPPPSEQQPSFYTSRLKLLFFTALSNPRSRDDAVARTALEPLIGRVPFLNGGLFAQEELDERRGVDVPDAAIEAILRDLLARFNFTVIESTPYDVEVAVDPEMLGKVFEELVTGRHETGSYYTSRPVVVFMCRKALNGYLAAQVEGLSATVATAFVDDHEIGGMTMTQAGAVLAALERITVVDPACGSGAYLLGMLHELVELQKLLYNSVLIAGARELYDLKLRVIERNVYGVDKERFAVNIAMLRLWLSLVVDYEGPLDDLSPLPNLDYKIACGDSLTAPDPRGFQQLALAHELIVKYRDAKGRYLHAYGEEKRLERVEVDALRRDIDAMPRAGTQTTTGLDWAVEFAEVFERGGFDVVLANPPYVRADAQYKHLSEESARQAAIAEWKEYRAHLLASHVYKTLYEKWDLYLPFLERAHQLLRPDGHMVFIISDAYNGAKYALKSQQFFLGSSRVSRIDFCSDIPLFKAGVSNTILHIEKSESLSNVPVRVRRWGEKPEEFVNNVQVLPTAPQEVLGSSLFRVDGVNPDETKKDSIRLGDICYISYGLRANADDKHWPGEFTTDDCLSPVKDNTHPKPFVQGKDLMKWRAWRVWYLEWGTARAPHKFSRPTFSQLHEVQEKIIAVRTPGATPKAIFDSKQLHFDASSVGFISWHSLEGIRNRSIQRTALYQDEVKNGAIAHMGREEFEAQSRKFTLKYILSIMNSTFAKKWLAAKRRSKITTGAS